MIDGGILEDNGQNIVTALKSKRGKRMLEEIIERDGLI